MLGTKTRFIVFGCCLAAFALPAAVDGQTVSYWRHEEGPLGATVPVGEGTVLDSSGNGNTMRTFNEFTGATYTSDVAPLPLRSGLPNTLALDFNFDQDGTGPDLNDDNYTGAVPMNTRAFDALSVEFAFKMDSVGGYHTLVGKDGKPIGGPLPPLAIKVRGDDFPGGIQHQLQAEWVDGDGDEVFLASGFSIVPGTWYHVAFVVDDTAAGLWIAEGLGPYVLADELTGDDFAGPGGEVMAFADRSFTTGRGMFNDGVADWSDAVIDEVRITDGALTPDGFLFIPEPASAGIALLGLLVCCRRR